jgi:hypothetical protein
MKSKITKIKFKAENAKVIPNVNVEQKAGEFLLDENNNPLIEGEDLTLRSDVLHDVRASIIFLNDEFCILITLISSNIYISLHFYKILLL